jgi:GAF domain-containing protein
VIGLFGISRDITDRRLAEDELRRVNRALRALVACTQAAAHAPSEPALLNDVCRIIVEIGGYRMAWVAFANRDDEKSITPVAQAGFDDGYLETLHLTWADGERGRGPVGTAIRTGQPAAAHHIQADPDFGPWREAAMSRGYASSLAIPLRSASGTYGVCRHAARV